MKAHAALLIATLVLAPLAVNAQDTTVVPPALLPAPTFSRTATEADSAFVYSMLARANTQLALANLAQQNGQRSSTRDRAAREIAQWTAVHDRLMAIADTQGLRTPDATDAGAQATFTEGSYAATVAATDQRAMRAIEAERVSSNPALISFVNDYLNGFGSAEPQHR